MPKDRYIPDLSEVPPDPADPVPRSRDPHLLGIDALIDYAASPDASLVPTPGPLILTREQGTALLLALHRSGVKQAHRLTGAGRPADGDPPRIARPPLTDAEIAAALEPLRRDIEQAGGRLEVRYEEPATTPTDPSEKP